MTLVMVIMICVGCALILAGAAVLGVRAMRLAKAARDAGVSSEDYVQSVIRAGREAELRAGRVADKQRVVAERLSSLSATIAELNYLRDQIDEATGHVFTIKS